MPPERPIVLGEPIAKAPRMIGNTEVVGLNYDVFNLTISISDKEDNRTLVVFQNVQGFRVLDERDLMEFWPKFSTPAGWAFRITKGGWYDHESKRVRCFLIPEVAPEAKEFLFTGCNDCVSVISIDDPNGSMRIPGGRTDYCRPFQYRAAR